MTRNIFALADCNSAYASFECVFAPWLRDKAIIVLSNNDGNVVTRNNQAKAAGIKMGQPWWEVRGTPGLVAFSSNFSLYGSMSNRVMRVLASHAPGFSQYSIDEAWLLLTGLTSDVEQRCRMIKADVMRRVGVPIGIGIAHTKVLAKLANWAAKKWGTKTGGVVDLRDPVRVEKLLRYAPVDEVWGIGPRLAKRLAEDLKITTAWELASAPPALLRKQLGVTVERTARELAGIQCFALEEGPTLKQSITASRSFGKRVYQLDELEAAVAAFVAKSAFKLRAQGSACHLMQVFARTSPFDNGPRYGGSRSIEFTSPTSDTRRMTAAAMEAVGQLYRPNIPFAKAGVILSGFVETIGRTQDMFAPQDSPKTERLMAVMDAINRREGAGTVRLARERAGGDWTMRQDFLSPRYTTRWEDLPVVNKA